jgi:hypothetical protein
MSARCIELSENACSLKVHVGFWKRPSSPGVTAYSRELVEARTADHSRYDFAPQRARALLKAQQKWLGASDFADDEKECLVGESGNSSFDQRGLILKEDDDPFGDAVRAFLKRFVVKP